MIDPLKSEPIDISIPLALGVPVWPGDTPYSCGWTARRENAASINLAAVSTSFHAGTHADAPLHVESHWPASESLPPAVFIGECIVVSVAHVRRISFEIDVPELTSLGDFTYAERVLVHTGHSVSNGSFPEEWPTLSEEAVLWLLETGVRLVGTDAPSVDSRYSKTLPIHHRLFDAGAYVLENLSLSHVAPGRYNLLAQPIAVHGADAAPVRALLYPAG